MSVAAQPPQNLVFYVDKVSTSCLSLYGLQASKFNYLGQDLKKTVDRFFADGGFENPPWEHWLLTMGPMSAPNYFVNAPSWDGVKREATRKVLAAFRESFHKFPRPW